MKFIAEYSLKENLRRKCYFIVCLITCFLISLVSLVAKTIVSQGSLIFLMIGEKDSGEIDFYINVLSSKRNRTISKIDDYYRDNTFINFTKYEEIMKDSKKENEDEDDKIKNPFDSSVVRTYYNGYSPYNQLYLMLIDTEKEKTIELGRSYPYNKLKKGECLVHKNLIMNEKNKFNISINMEDFLVNTLLYYYHDLKNETNPELEKYLEEPDRYLTFVCDIIGTFDDNYGKESGNDDNIVIMEQEYFYEYILDFLPDKVKEYFPDYKNFVKLIKSQEYGNVLLINFPKNRLNYYTGDDYDALLDTGVKYMNKIVQRMGNLQNYKVNMPLIRTMERYKFGTTLLNLILNLILLGIFGLSLILIHSLLLITTETNSFEFGVLRLVGNSKKNVILLIIFQCICFSIPAFIVALFFSFFILRIINGIIRSELNTDLDITLTLDSFIMAFFLNFLAPIIAAIFPIRNILKKNIASSINTMLNKTQGIKVEVISLQKKELTSLIIFGLITFIYGASIYYFLPLSLISLNFGMIGGIFLWILFGILLGFVLLSRNIENILQKILTYAFLFFTRSYTKLLILKNLAAHRIKNKKTSLMFSLSVGIFIMTSVGFDLILQSTKNIIIQQNGSEVVVYNDDDYFLTEDIYPCLMELYDRKLIDSFSLYTLYLGDICLESSIYITNYGKTVQSKNNFLGITSDYFGATTKNDLKISEQDNKYKEFTPSEQLYLSEFKGKTGISGILKYEFNADLQSQIFIQFLNKNQEMIFLSKPAFILDSAGGLSMNNQPSMLITREAILSIPLYLDMLQKCRNYFAESYDEVSIVGYEDLPVWGINIKPKELATERDIDIISSIIRNFGPGGDSWFFANMKNRLDIASNIVHILFYIISTIVLIFCLFNLTASMTVNIYEQKKEIAILRSLGTKRRHVIFIYVAESFILILSSSIIGSIIGGIISYTMALQWTIFTNVNVTFNLPTGSIILIILFSIFGGILSTYFPAKNMLNNTIAQLIKSG